MIRLKLALRVLFVKVDHCVQEQDIATSQISYLWNMTQLYTTFHAKAAEKWTNRIS